MDETVCALTWGAVFVCISGGETRGSANGDKQSNATVPSADAPMVIRGKVKKEREFMQIAS